MIHLDQSSQTPLYEQIYEQIRHSIVEGIYLPKSKLPSIRGLAESLHCSRNTVEAAYRMLIQEGFARSRPGSGIVVEDGAFDRVMLDAKHLYASGSVAIDDLDPHAGQPSPHASVPAAGAPQGSCAYDFTYGNLQEGTFPAIVWKSLTDDVLLGLDTAKADCYSDALGEPELRREIARRQAGARGVRCNPDQVVLQGGTQPSLQNLLLLFDPARDVVAMENPGYDGARTVFENNRFTLHPCPTHQGDPNAYLAAVEESGAKLAYVTPSNQFPIGAVLPMEPRLKLLEWARRNDAYLIEDDYCHEFCYGARPQPSLQSLDEHGRVIYMGTFSKSLSPALRMNYLILPPALLEQWKQTFHNAYPSVPWLSQEVLYRYLVDGLWDRRLRRIQVRNRRKYDLLTSTLRETMGSRVDLMENGAGLHLLVNVRDGRSQDELIALARAAGVAVYGTDRYWMTPDHPLESCVLVGFSAIEEEAIVPGVCALAKAWFGE